MSQLIVFVASPAKAGAQLFAMTHEIVVEIGPRRDSID